MKNLFVIVSLILLFSCESEHAYKKFDKNFESNRWKETDVKSYEFIIDKQADYDIIIHFAHIFDYDMNTIPLTVSIKYPDGNKSVEKLDLLIKDVNGKQLADCAGDICDLYYTLKSNQKLPLGSYSVAISNQSKYRFLPNVLGIGLTVTSTK